jgi:hypothetical protein
MPTVLAALLHSGRAARLVAVFAPPADPAFVGAERFGLHIGALPQVGSTVFTCIFLFYDRTIICRLVPGKTGALAIRLDGIHRYTERIRDLLIPLARRAHLADASLLCVVHGIFLPKMRKEPALTCRSLPFKYMLFVLRGQK